jgi:hypothetical protein
MGYSQTILMISPKVMHPALYRVSQFFAAIKARLPAWAGGVTISLTAADQMLLASVMPTRSQQRLFARMPANDQRHAIAVARTLQEAGYSQPALLQAALLHDAGKSMGQPILHRVLIVLFEAFWPVALQRLSTPGSTESGIHNSLIDNVPFWRRPFVIHARHPAIGAAWAEAVDCEPVAIELIARHQDKLTGQPTNETDELLAALQWADDLN